MDTIELDRETEMALEKIPTVSDRIRLLDKQGFPRAEIARILGKRYQHVRNVLEQDARKVESSQPEPMPGAKWHLTITPNGQLVLPEAVRAGLPLGPGGEVIVALEGDELRVTPVIVALRKAQALVRRFDTGHGSAVKDLIADRRAESGRE